MQRWTAVGIMILCLTLVLAGGQALAVNTVIGVNYGPYHYEGQSPASRTNIPDAQIVADLQRISQKFQYIKTYGSDPVLAKIVPLISQHNLNLKVAVGIYEAEANRTEPGYGTLAQIQTAIAQAKQYPHIVNMVVVGNECIQGPDNNNTPSPVPVATLIADLQTVKAALPDTPVTTCFSYQGAQQYASQLVAHTDNTMVNIYPYYGNVPISGAVQNLVDAIKSFNHGKPVWVGETGWPSGGGDPNYANLVNEKRFTSEVMNRVQHSQPSDPPFPGIYFFEAFDEPWLSAQNPIGPHWGLWNSDRSTKVFPDHPMHHILLLHEE